MLDKINKIGEIVLDSLFHIIFITVMLIIAEIVVASILKHTDLYTVFYKYTKFHNYAYLDASESILVNYDDKNNIKILKGVIFDYEYFKYNNCEPILVEKIYKTKYPLFDIAEKKLLCGEDDLIESYGQSTLYLGESDE